MPVVKRFRELARLALDPKQPAETGTHCKYCGSRTVCPAFLGECAGLLEMAAFNPENVDNPAALGRELEYLILAETKIKAAKRAFEDVITARIENGQPVKGWCIGGSRGRRVWKATLEEIKSAGVMCGAKLTKETPLALSVAWKNKAARPLLETLICKKAGAKKLVPFDESDIGEVFK